jgi:hypothetical protein
MVLAMFVDADRLPLLTALAGGRLFITPSIADPIERPPFNSQPTAEFARGAYYFQGRLGYPLDAVRLNRRTAFYLAMGDAWRPTPLSPNELQLAATFVDPATWRRAEAADPRVRIKKLDRGEAECAAVAVTRRWRLWSDDAAVVGLLAALYPNHPTERISDLLERAVAERLIPCDDATHLYNNDFKTTLRLWARLTAACERGGLVFR